MKKNLTELVFILDRSGSMHGLESDAIGGFNGMLQKQKALAGNALVTTVLFSDSATLLHDRTAIQGVEALTGRDYTAGGMTALLDAVGSAILKIQSAQDHTAEPERPDKTIFVITTDGQENASREFTQPRVKEMIQARQSQNGWEFLYLGANIDAVAAAKDIGIHAANAANYVSDSAGTDTQYGAVSAALHQLRASAPLSADWKAPLERDVQKRGRNTISKP